MLKAPPQSWQQVDPGETWRRARGSVADWRSDIQFPVVVRAEAVALLAEHAEAGHAHLLQPELQRCEKHAKPIRHAATEVDGGSLGKILGRAGNLADAKLEVGGLRQHFVAEHEIVC